MAVTVARDVIVCSGCGGARQVTDRTRRRSEQLGGIQCQSCRGFSPMKRVTDGDLRFWLRTYGVNLPRGVPVREFIVAGGAPQALVDLARQVHPDI